MDLTSYLLGKEAGGGGGTPTLQSKEVEITENGQTTVTADSGYDGLSSVAVTTNVQGGGDLSEYFNDTITQNTSSSSKAIPKLIKKLPNITIANNVTSLESAFNDEKIEEIGKIISAGSNVTSLSRMFYSCGKLKTVDFSNFNSSNVTSTDNMFCWCEKLENVNFDNFDTIKVTNMADMFRNCYVLTQLNLSSFYTPNLTTSSQMFGWCEKLQKIDIRNMTFDNVTSYTDMFTGIPSNCEIIVKDDTQKTWITSKFSNLTNVKTVAEL